MDDVDIRSSLRKAVREGKRPRKFDMDKFVQVQLMTASHFLFLSSLYC